MTRVLLLVSPVFHRAIAAAAMALVIGGCAPAMTVSSHSATGLDFTQYRTYDWGPADALPTGDPRLDADPYFRDDMAGAVERELRAKGFTLIATGRPDLLIHYHASVATRIDVSRADRGYSVPGDEPNVVEFEAGTIVLDIVDVRTNRVIWRGWAQENLADMLKNPSRMARRIDEAVRRMLERFPAAPARTLSPGEK